jgi:hypothetical protein
LEVITLKTKELLDIANKGYPDGFLATYYDKNGKFCESTGDSLARFIVVELIETFDPKLTDEEQLDSAVRTLERAKQDIQDVINSLQQALVDAVISKANKT